MNNEGVTFKYKDYRVEGRKRYKTMTLEPHEFIRRFLTHVLPRGFHRIRHYGLFANGGRAKILQRHGCCWVWRSHNQNATPPSRPKIRTTNRRSSPVPVPSAADA